MARDVRCFDIFGNIPPTFSLLLKKKYCEAFISGMWCCLTKKKIIIIIMRFQGWSNSHVTSRFRKGGRRCWEKHKDLRPSLLLDINIKVLYEGKEM